MKVLKQLKPNEWQHETDKCRKNMEKKQSN